MALIKKMMTGLADVNVSTPVSILAMSAAPKTVHSFLSKPLMDEPLS
jgi:hypothetical protein